ncbi:hypothetical protein [Clostridium sp. JNZ J1-5]
MKMEIFLKNSREPISFDGERIDVLDFENAGVKYKQIRVFRKLISKSYYIEENQISKIKTYS